MNAGVTPQGNRRFVVALPADCSRASGLRRLVTAHLRHWGLAGLADEAQLVAHELYANAVVHGSGADDLVTVEVEARGGELYIGVADSSPAAPVVGVAAEDAECGRGLAMVEQLASSWDSKVDGLGKVVWATLRIREERDSRRAVPS